MINFPALHPSFSGHDRPVSLYWVISKVSRQKTVQNCFCELKKNVNENTQKGFIKSKLDLTNLSVLYNKKETWPAHWGRWFLPSTLSFWDSTWTTACDAGPLSTRRTCYRECREGSQRCSESWRMSSMKIGWESWDWLARRKEGSGETSQQLFSTQQAPGSLERHFQQECMVKFHLTGAG